MSSNNAWIRSISNASISISPAAVGPVASANLFRNASTVSIALLPLEPALLCLVPCPKSGQFDRTEGCLDTSPTESTDEDCASESLTAALVPTAGLPLLPECASSTKDLCGRLDCTSSTRLLCGRLDNTAPRCLPALSAEAWEVEMFRSSCSRALFSTLTAAPQSSATSAPEGKTRNAVDAATMLHSCRPQHMRR